MKVLFIGGTGIISTAISKKVIERGWDLWHLNRGSRPKAVPDKVKTINCDIKNEADCAEKLKDHSFDVIADFICFTPQEAERSYRLFKGKTKQYIFIHTASAYQKPINHYLINESTPRVNPYWKYSREKIACEDFFMAKYREEGFPVTFVFPSHTYDERKVPMGVHGDKGSWQVIKRMLDGKKVIIHGDGTSLWTMTSNKDFAEGFIGLMGNHKTIGESINIMSDESLNWNQIFKIIADCLNVPLNAVHISSEFLAKAGSQYDFNGSLLGDKANSVVFDNSKLKRLVPGFTAKIRFDEGVKKTLDYVLSHKECQEDDPEFDAWCDRVIASQEKAIKESS